MNISTKGRYALSYLTDLALCGTSEPLSVKESAKHCNISEKYLEQIISILNKAGYVRSIRGPQGGYFLSKKPEEYTVGMILRQTEGDLAPVSCVGTENPGCERQEECVTVKIWQQINDAVNGVIDNITLANLVEWQAEKANNYVI